ncbi:H-2 class II histocompatibility antigen, A-F beta chain [Triplophysa rosa]|uniref:Mamu class II histocompatibility antigen n=1 Tax=Triplophysa rosa TaxID=992332 RepID=A0A9W7WN79_TRIRA|nr:H-2 class II histocompatibility antigen, A-F beta chain [Triplophysa rosa]KAI7805262.1 putative mamu class II histocompatibility antigen [Triplophysa rosa]
MQAFMLIVAFAEIILGADEHAFQQFIECSFNNEGQVDRLWKYGYDGKDMMHIDLVNQAVVATSEPGERLAEERQSKEYIKRKEDKLKMVCSAVKTVFLLSNNSLSKAVKPDVFLSSGGKKEEEYLKCAVRGFYPNVIRVRWTQTGRPIYYGVSTTRILPHRDGRFQITSYLSLRNISAHGVTCEIEHLSINEKLRIIYEKKSRFLSAFTEPVFLAAVVFLLGFVLSVCLTLSVSWIWEHKRKPHQDDSHDTSADSDTSMNLMNVLQET